MKATLTGEIQLQNGSWLKDPYVRHGKEIRDTKNKSYLVEFLLCVLVTEIHQPLDGDGNPVGDPVPVAVEKVIQKKELRFNTNSQDAKILVNGAEEDLIPYLMGGGTFVEEDVVSWGYPYYDELDQYFDSPFSGLQFKDTPLKFIAELWGLHNIKFDGKSMKELGFQWVQE